LEFPGAVIFTHTNAIPSNFKLIGFGAFTSGTFEFVIFAVPLTAVLVAFVGAIVPLTGFVAFVGAIVPLTGFVPLTGLVTFTGGGIDAFTSDAGIQKNEDPLMRSTRGGIKAGVGAGGGGSGIELLVPLTTDVAFVFDVDVVVVFVVVAPITTFTNNDCTTMTTNNIFNDVDDDVVDVAVVVRVDLDIV